MYKWTRLFRRKGKSLWRALSSHQLIRSASYLISGAAGGQLIIALSSPVVTRLFTPEEFGVLAIYSAFLGIMGGASLLRYDFVIPLPEEDRDGQHVLMLALSSLCGTVIVVGALVWAFGSEIAAAWNLQAISPYLWLLPIGILGVGGYRAFNYWAIRVKEFKVIARTKLYQSSAMVATQIGAGVAGIGTLGLLVGQVAGQAAGVRSLASVFGKTRDPAATTVSDMKELAHRYRDFPIYSGPGVLLSSAGLHVPALCFAGLFSAQVAGWYMLAERVVNKPVSIVGQATAQVYMGEAAELARTAPGKLRRLFLRATGLLLLIALVPAIILVLYAPSLFGFIFGGEWTVAGQYVQMLVPMLVTRFTISPVAETLNIIEEQALQLGWEVIRLTLVVLSFWTSFLIDLSDLATVGLFSVAMSISYILLGIISYLQVGNRK